MDMKITKKDLEKRFNELTGTPAQNEDCDKLRKTCISLANKINKSCPDSREKSLALTKLEEVLFWTIASIAREE